METKRATPLMAQGTVVGSRVLARLEMDAGTVGYGEIPGGPFLGGPGSRFGFQLAR